MSITERIARFCVYTRFGRSSSESDGITDYLDLDNPDYRGAWKAFVMFHRYDMQYRIRKLKGFFRRDK